MPRLPSFIKNPKDFFSGVLFLAIAGVFAYGLRELPIGTAFRMGPGYYPMVLAGLLAFLGVIIMIGGLRTEGEPISGVPWRGFILIVLPVIFFGATLKGLGMVPSLAITVFVTTLASVHWNLRTALINTVVLTVGGWLIFIKALGLPIVVFGPWVGGY
jgi:putative tricarboxylic transport membrane protein